MRACGRACGRVDGGLENWLLLSTRDDSASSFVAHVWQQMCKFGTNLKTYFVVTLCHHYALVFQAGRACFIRAVGIQFVAKHLTRDIFFFRRVGRQGVIFEVGFDDLR